MVVDVVAAVVPNGCLRQLVASLFVAFLAGQERDLGKSCAQG